jgi:hypothetical protein
MSRLSHVIFAAFTVITVGAASPLFAADGSVGVTQVSMVVAPKSANVPVTVIPAETAACACGGKPFPVFCPGSAKAICLCNPPSFKCAK